MPLSKKQIRVLNKIKELCQEKPYSPSIREIGKALGISSPSTVHQYLTRLRDRGYIQWEPDRPRTLKVIIWEEVVCG